MTSVTASDYTLVLTLTTLTGIQLDITNLMRQFNLYQDMFAPTMTGNVTIDDAANLFDTLPIAGYETLTVLLQTMDNGKPIVFEKEFRVFAVENYMPVSQNHRAYTIKFATKSAYANRENVFYNMKKLTLHDAIKPILTDKLGLTETEFTFNDTEGALQRPMLFGYKHPFDIIKKLCNKALGKGTNATYVFYENRNAFTLDSIERLTSLEPARSYYYIPAAGEVATRYLKDRVYGFRIESVFNRLEHELSGARNIQTVTHNLVNKAQSISTYDYADRFKEISHMESNPFISNIEAATNANRVYQSACNTTLDAIDPSTNSPVEVTARRTNQLQNLATLKLIAEVPGDLYNELGHVIDFQLNAKVSNQPAVEKHKYLSGKYLITAIHHVIDQYRYQQVLELTKDSLPDTLSPSDSATTITDTGSQA